MLENARKKIMPNILHDPVWYYIPNKGIRLVVAFPFPVQLKHGKWADDGVSEPPF